MFVCFDFNILTLGMLHSFLLYALVHHLLMVCIEKAVNHYHL